MKVSQISLSVCVSLAHTLKQFILVLFNIIYLEYKWNRQFSAEAKYVVVL
jgi:hypothetical protein